MAIDPEQALAQGAAAAGNELQSEADALLPVVNGMFTETSINALIDAVNQALEATGFEGELPEHEGNATQIPVEVMRAIAMLNDAAMELGLGDLGIEVIEDDTDLAMLASSIVQLSQDQEFIAAMTEPAMDPMAEPMSAAPMTAPTGMPAGGMPDEEALMMEHM